MILRAGVHGVARGARGEGHERAPGHGDEDLRSISGGDGHGRARGSIGATLAGRGVHQRHAPRRRLRDVPTVDVARAEGLRVAVETLEFRLFQFVVVVHGEDARLAEERHHEVLVRGGVVGWAETPAALHAGKLNRRLLVDAHAVSNDAQGSVPLDAGARHHLALAVPIEIHHRKVDDGTEVGETLEHLYESAPLLRGQGRRVQPHELTIAVRGADVHHAVIQIRQRARDGRVPERFQLERVHALTVVHEHEQMQRARRVGQEMPGAVRVHDAVRHDVGGSRRHRASDDSGGSPGGAVAAVAAVFLVEVDDDRLADDDGAAEGRWDGDDEAGSALDVVLRPRSLCEILVLHVHLVCLDVASLLGVLVQHRDGGLGAPVEEFDVQDYELLEADVELAGQPFWSMGITLKSPS